MLKRLETFNALPEKDALAELLSVCTSTVWVSAVLDQRPFKDQTALLAASEAAWQLTGEGDWLEAFEGHPKIGDAQALQGGAETTAMQEQGQVSMALASTREALARLNQIYLDRFGFIFIVCATGKSAAEMLGLLNARIDNSREVELSNGAREQAAIMLLRVDQLFSQPELTI